jgi:hypothetical protein
VTHFADLASARGALPPATESILAAHEEMLGLPLGACLGRRRADDVDADVLSEETLESILAGRVVVSATMGGFWGDCATTSSAYHLFCEGPRPDAFPRNDADYRRLVTSRQVLRASARPTLSAAALVMAANLGIDLRELAPPFFPTRRAQDLVFGALLRRCFDGRFVGFVPVAVGHLPAQERRADPDALWGTARPKFAELLFHALYLAPLDMANPGAARLRVLGRHLRELAELPWPDLERMLVQRVWQATAKDVRTLQDRIALADPASPWARDARAYREALLATFRATDLALPDGFRANRSPEEARALVQRLIGRFGALLDAWPELFAAAKRLRARGVSLASPA